MQSGGLCDCCCNVLQAKTGELVDNMVLARPLRFKTINPDIVLVASEEGTLMFVIDGTKCCRCRAIVLGPRLINISACEL